MDSAFDPAIALRAAEANLGPLLSTHRRKLTSLGGLLLACLFCFAVVIALVVVAIQQYEALEIAKRLGMAAIFLGGGSILVWAAWRTIFTRVDLAERGLLYTYGETLAIRWEDIGPIEVVRVSGRVKSLNLHAKGKVLLVGSELSGFKTIVRALKTHGVLRQDFVE